MKSTAHAAIAPTLRTKLVRGDRSAIARCKPSIGWMQRSQQRRQLRELDDRALRDIGLSRAEVNAEADKPFWM